MNGHPNPSSNPTSSANIKQKGKQVNQSHNHSSSTSVKYPATAPVVERVPRPLPTSQQQVTKNRYHIKAEYIRNTELNYHRFILVLWSK